MFQGADPERCFPIIAEKFESEGHPRFMAVMNWQVLLSTDIASTPAAGVSGVCRGLA